jgi:hypothetical protein
MKSYSSIRIVRTAAVLCGSALAVSLLAHRVNADEWDKKTTITVDQPIQITDTYLDPGTYVLKLDRSPSDRHIVRIYNAEENHLYNTVLAIPNYRVQRTGNTRFTFWETPSGTPRALKDWFYPGDNFGQEFPYPKHLRQLAVAGPAPAPPAPPPVPQAEPETPAPAPQAPVAETTPQKEEPVEVAQNTPPPTPPAPPAEAAPAPAQPEPTQSQELPKTASPYPTIGLVGLFAVALYGLIRAKRLA